MESAGADKMNLAAPYISGVGGTGPRRPRMAVGYLVSHSRNMRPQRDGQRILYLCQLLDTMIHAGFVTSTTFKFGVFGFALASIYSFKKFPNPAAEIIVLHEPARETDKCCGLMICKRAYIGSCPGVRGAMERHLIERLGLMP